MKERTMLRAAVLAACLTGATALTASPVEPADDSPTSGAGIGPAVGTEAPDFQLESVTDGSEHTLSEHRGERPVVMVFFRGAW